MEGILSYAQLCQRVDEVLEAANEYRGRPLGAIRASHELLRAERALAEEKLIVAQASIAALAAQLDSLSESYLDAKDHAAQAAAGLVEAGQKLVSGNIALQRALARIEAALELCKNPFAPAEDIARVLREYS